MKRLRIAFLLPRYSQPSKSHMPVVMQMLSERGVVVDVLHPSDRAIDLSAVRVEHDLYVLKSTNGLALSIAGVLHAQGAAIVNPYPISLALRDKIIASRILQSAGVPTPATYTARHPEQFRPLLDAGPIVVKPYQGGSGEGVRIVQRADELADVPEVDKIVFAQRYHRPDAPDLKIYAIGGRLFGVRKIFPAKTEDEKHGQPFTPTPELAEIAFRCGRAFGIDLYGVDILESEGRPYVVDMNSMPGFKGVPDAPSHLATYLYRAAERAARGQLRQDLDSLHAEPQTGDLAFANPGEDL
jgi:ribosomal protein S6--L-glutamate ligase